MPYHQIITGVELGREKPEISQEKAGDPPAWSGRLFGLGHKSERTLKKLADGMHLTELSALAWAVDAAYEQWFMHSLLGPSQPSQEDAMTDKPREWPTNAMDARDRAAEMMLEASKTLKPVHESEKDLENLRRVDKAMLLVSDAVRLLESVGARTRP